MSKSNKYNVTRDKAAFDAKKMALIGYGRKEITTKKQLEKYKIGSLISYLNTSNLFKQGGFITKFADDYFIYITPDFDTKYKVRYENVDKMWVGEVNTVVNDIISLVPTPRKKTNFPVTVDDVVIYYGKNSFDANRFKSTDKYKRLVMWNDYFNVSSDA